MCNKYYPAIISQIERTAHEFYVSFVIITWYMGSVIGSFMTIHLHTINRCKSELVLLAAGILFILCLVIETQTESSVCDYFLMRIVLGALIAIIYLSSAIGRFQISLFICTFTMVAIISMSPTKTSPEMSCVTLTLVYSLLALTLSKSKWIFEPQIDLNVFKSIKQTKPLIYLTGAKLLTVFCYFLPFACIILLQPRASAAFNHLIVLFFTRLSLGIITIFVFQKNLLRHNVNYSTIFYLLIFTISLAIVILMPLLDFRRTAAELCVIVTYVAFSLFVDIIGHCAASNADIDSDLKVISLTFATFIEHLIDIAIAVIYLNDWISAKLILTSLGIICLSILPRPKRKTDQKYQIL